MPKVIDKVDETKEVKESFTVEDVKELATKMAKEMMKEFKKEELENKIEETKDKVEEKKIVKKKRKRVLDLDDLVLVKSNVDGLLIAKALEGRTRVNTKFKKMGDTKWLSVNEIRDLKDHTELLAKGQIAIEEYESDEHDLEDLYAFLGLTDLYMGDGISPKDIVEALVEDMDANKFQNALNNSDDIGQTVLDVAQVLRNEGKIRESHKLNSLRQKVSFSNTYKF